MIYANRKLNNQNKKEIDNSLFNAHKRLFNWIELSKKGRVRWEHFDIIQRNLLNVTGYEEKEVNYNRREVFVSFKQNLSLNNELVGKGKNELEAICNACENLIENSYYYNSYSGEYFKALKI